MSVGPSISPAYPQNHFPPPLPPVWRSHRPRVVPSLHGGAANKVKVDFSVMRTHHPHEAANNLCVLIGVAHSPAKSPLPSMLSSGSPSGLY